MVDSNSAIKGQWSALWLCFLTTVANYIPYTGYSTQIPQMMKDLSMNYTMVGTLASVSALSGGLVFPFAGVLVDKWGAKNVTLLGLLICSIGQVVFAYMPDYQWMLFSRVILGIGIALLFVAPYAMAIRWFEQSDKIGISLGVMFTTDGIGTVVALYLYSLILIEFGWRGGSAIGAIIVFVMFVISAIYMKEPPHFANAQPENNGRPERKGSLLKEYLAAIGHKNVFVASSFFIGVWGSLSLAIYWVPTLLMEESGWSEGLAGFVGALYPLAGMICAVGCGLISDRMGKRKPFILVAGLGMTLSFVGFAIALIFQQYTWLAVMLPLSGLFAYGGMPLSLAMATDTVGSKYAASVTGLIFGIAFILGGVVYPLALGYIKDATNMYTAGFFATAASLFILNFLIALIGKDVKNTQTKDMANLSA
ncbi:MFS transporter [Brevibacillus fluminis]|uniref:MFS transporter n=1 Tax=Brevibacillus fluminis TaxID=511487 RepID=A0A3M8DDT7_9BACL|nr:MFS transporter [Brevibacillus fluminis]RNB85465.1 MFS transporter [Brevibacillus fluminis]